MTRLVTIHLSVRASTWLVDSISINHIDSDKIPRSGGGHPRQTSLVIMSFGVDLCRRIMFSGICVLASAEAEAWAPARKKDTKGLFSG